jgi:tRNA threonylcarbamoyladenosine biosynthesis protein TsaB
MERFNAVLGLDTSTTACSVALMVNGDVVAHRFEEMSRGQAERLNPMSAEVMADAGRGFHDLDLIAVSTGPGAFTGLRIGLACARALALAADLPVAGVTTFAALARAVPDGERSGRALAVCVNARRRDVFAQLFDDALVPAGAPRSLTPEEAVDTFADGRFLLAGDGVGQIADALVAAGDAGADAAARVRFSSALGPPDARHVAFLGAAAGPSDPLPRPFYIRPADARLPGTR